MFKFANPALFEYALYIRLGTIRFFQSPQSFVEKRLVRMSRHIAESQNRDTGLRKFRWSASYHHGHEPSRLSFSGQTSSHTILISNIPLFNLLHPNGPAGGTSMSTSSTVRKSDLQTHNPAIPLRSNVVYWPLDYEKVLLPFERLEISIYTPKNRIFRRYARFVLIMQSHYSWKFLNSSSLLSVACAAQWRSLLHLSIHCHAMWVVWDR